MHGCSAPSIRVVYIQVLQAAWIRYVDTLITMVVIADGLLLVLEAYSHAPLTPEMSQAVRHGFYDGTYARYNRPQVTVTIHDRPDFYGISHYHLRNILDSEGSPAPFVVIDEKTPESGAVWYVETTEYCNLRSDLGPYVVTHPGENFTLWQGHMQVADLPISAVSFNVGCGELAETILNYYNPYDPHDPQNHIISMGLNWTDPKTALQMWGSAYIRANWSEVEWSTDPEIRRHWLPQPPAVARLSAEAASVSGLLQSWCVPPRVGPIGKEVQLTAPYDLESPLWPKGYPDDGLLASSAASQHPIHPNAPSNTAEGMLVPPIRRRIRTMMCPRAQLERIGHSRTVNRKRHIKQAKL